MHQKKPGPWVPDSKAPIHTICSLSLFLFLSSKQMIDVLSANKTNKIEAKQNKNHDSSSLNHVKDSQRFLPSSKSFIIPSPWLKTLLIIGTREDWETKFSSFLTLEILGPCSRVMVVSKLITFALWETWSESNLWICTRVSRILRAQWWILSVMND